MERDGEERKEKPMCWFEKKKKKKCRKSALIDPSQSIFAPTRCILIGPHFCSVEADAVIKLLPLQRVSKRHGHQVWTWGHHSPSALRALLSQPDAFCRLLQIWTRLTWWWCKVTYVKKTQRWVKKKRGISWQSERAQILGGEVVMWQNKPFGKS